MTKHVCHDPFTRLLPRRIDTKPYNPHQNLQLRLNRTYARLELVQVMVAMQILCAGNHLHCELHLPIVRNASGMPKLPHRTCSYRYCHTPAYDKGHFLVIATGRSQLLSANRQRLCALWPPGLQLRALFFDPLQQLRMRHLGVFLPNFSFYIT